MGRKEKGDLVTQNKGDSQGWGWDTECVVEPPAHQIPVDLHPGPFLIPVNSQICPQLPPLLGQL